MAVNYLSKKFITLAPGGSSVTTLSIMTIGIITLITMTIGITSLSMMTIHIMICNTVTLSKMTLNDTQLATLWKGLISFKMPENAMPYLLTV